MALSVFLVSGNQVNVFQEIFIYLSNDVSSDRKVSKEWLSAGWKVPR